MRSSVRGLMRTAVQAAARPPSTAVATATVSSAAGKQAVGELEVYLRAMKAAQRRWTREIAAHETHVRRLMMAEEQCRERLKQQVLKDTRAHLRYLTNTDLMAVAQLVSPPSVDVFLAYGIPPEQVSGFTVYVMGCVAADPNRLNVPLPILLADLSSRWTIVPPRKKEAYSQLAAIFRPHLHPRTASVPEAANTTRLSTTPAVRRQQPSSTASRGSVRRRRQSGSATATPRRRPTRRTTVSSPSAEATAGGKASNKSAAAVHSAGKRLRVRSKAATATACPAPAPPSTSPASPAAPTLPATSPAQPPAAPRRVRGGARAQSRHRLTSGTTARPTSRRAATRAVRCAETRRAAGKAITAYAAADTRIPDAERAAFCKFAAASRSAMEAALGVPLVSPTADSGDGSTAVTSKATRVAPSQMAMESWMPIAAEEWLCKTRRQKDFYM